MRKSIRYVGLIGEIYFAFNLRQSVKQAFAPCLIDAAQSALHLTQRLFALTFCFSVNEIGQTLSLGQIHTAIFKSPPRKLARLSLTRVRRQ